MDNNPPQDSPQAMLERLKQQAAPLSTQALERAKATWQELEQQQAELPTNNPQSEPTWGPQTQQAPDSPFKATSDQRLMQDLSQTARELLTPERLSKLGISPAVLGHPQ
jgi:hypothetical protein